MTALLDRLRQYLAAQALVLACNLHGPTVDLLMERSVRDMGWAPPATPQRLDS
jgi:hypothetical protein